MTLKKCRRAHVDIAQTALNKVVRGFEAGFSEVVEFDHSTQTPSRDPNGKPYVTVGIGNCRSWQQAIAIWRKHAGHAAPYKNGNKLYWRTRPEIEKDGIGDGGWMVYSRLSTSK